MMTLKQLMETFPTEEASREFVFSRRWPNGVTCPTCGSSDVRFLANQKRWECKKGKHPKKQFSAKVGTIFEDSPIGLQMACRYLDDLRLQERNQQP